MKMKLGFMLGALMIILTGCNGKISCDDPEIARGILATIAQKMEDTKNSERIADDGIKRLFRGGDKINISNLAVETQEVDETDVNTAQPDFLYNKRVHLEMLRTWKLNREKLVKMGIDVEEMGMEPELNSQTCSYRIKDTISNKYVISFHKHQHLFYKYTNDDRWKLGVLVYRDDLNRWNMGSE